MKNAQDLNIFANSTDSLSTANPQNWWKVEKLVLLADNRVDYFLSDLRLIFDQQNQ